MAIVKGNEILYVYSGGSGNNDPAESLGGSPSAFQITGSLNNLFDNVTNEEATSGSVDYRAFYIFNDSIDGTLFDTTLFLADQVGGGASVELGVTTNDDKQLISIPQPVTGGSLTMMFESDTFVWSHDPDLAIWGTNLQTELNALSQLSTVSVSTGVESGNNTFEVLFTDEDGSRNQELLVVDTNSLVGSPDVTIQKLVEGAPINFITTTIAVDTATPADVVFTFTDASNRIDVGRLLPADGFAIWVKRTTLPGTQPIEGDGMTVRVSGSAF